MKKIVVGILAHVDAGKTTLAESILYKSGILRKLGRVDNGDTALDTHTLERERGITIFAGQSRFELGDIEVQLLDTPGHVDFSAETERMLKVLDYAILVISGTDGVQSHTRTLWRLLQNYNVPTFILVTKMDFGRFTNKELMEMLSELDNTTFVDFTDSQDKRDENIAVCDEKILEKYFENGALENSDISDLIKRRKCVPCYFGSGLKGEGVSEFLDGLKAYLVCNSYPEEFGAKVYKITHDSKGERITHLKITGGSLKVRDTVEFNGKTEKINGIRFYYGEKFVTAETAEAGSLCAVTGMSLPNCGDGLGFEADFSKAYLEPVMNYRIILPEGCDAKTFLPKLKELEEEDPLLHVTWNTFLQEIHVSLMGDIQTEILKCLILERFGVDVEIDNGTVLYKETITNTVEGVGHYEPLRHYAEVHLIMEPLPRGSGLVFKTKCNEDSLARNWQNLILMHLAEKEHLGVLTGSPITDMKITLAAGRAHLKHTEGGDFRQATYRAVRQGLMQAQSELLEPWYSFRLELPTEMIGRGINDIRMMNGTFDPPTEIGGMSVLTGKAPVTAMNGYASVVASYSGGRGRLFCDVCGYEKCHNSDDIIDSLKYSPESDLDNSPDSVFCAHGGGFNVKWDKVSEYMHIESCLEQEKTPYEAVVNQRNFHIDDKELEAIMVREFGEDKHPFYRYSHHKTPAKPVNSEYVHVERNKCVIVDGYNVIFAWDELNNLAKENLSFARDRLSDILCNYAAFVKCRVILVFDAYKVKENDGKRITYNNINIVYTKEKELGDNYIEKLISEIGKNDNVKVVTSDNLIRLSAVRFGVSKVSAQDFEKEIFAVNKKIDEFLNTINKPRPQKIGELIKLIEEENIAE